MLERELTFDTLSVTLTLNSGWSKIFKLAKFTCSQVFYYSNNIFTVKHKTSGYRHVHIYMQPPTTTPNWWGHKQITVKSDFKEHAYKEFSLVRN